MLKRLSVRISKAGNHGIDHFIKGLPSSRISVIQDVGQGVVIDLLIEEREIDNFLSALGSHLADDAKIYPCVIHQDTDLPLKRPEVIDGLLTIKPYNHGKGQCINSHPEIPFVLTIQCEEAFGFGTHPSTIGALKGLVYLYRENRLKGKKVLDVGSGSGILSLAAWKLGASFVQGIDIDPRAVEEAARNKALNGCPDRHVKFTCMSCLELDLAGYHVILANLVPSVRDRFLRTDGPISRAAHCAFLVISGGKCSDREYVSLLEKRHGFRLVEEWKIDNWLTTLFQRR